MSLAKIISEVSDANERDGIIDRHSAVTAAVPQILADADLTEACVRADVSRRIASNSRKRLSETERDDRRQQSMFGLHATYVVDDGEGQIKRTYALSRSEFSGLIAIRQQSVNQDLAHLRVLREAARVTSDIWDGHPNWTWGQVEAEYARLQAVAA